MSQYVPDDDSDDVYEVDPVELCLRFGVSRAQHEQAQERVTTLRRWRQHGLTEDWVSTVLWPGARFPDLIFLVGPDHRHAVERGSRRTRTCCRKRPRCKTTRRRSCSSRDERDWQ